MCCRIDVKRATWEDTHTCVMSSLGTHMNESCHTFEHISENRGRYVRGEEDRERETERERERD